MIGLIFLLLAVGAIWYFVNHSRKRALQVSRMRLGEMNGDLMYCSGSRLFLKDRCWLVSVSLIFGGFEPVATIRVSLSGKDISTDPEDLDDMVKKYEMDDGTVEPSSAGDVATRAAPEK